MHCGQSWQPQRLVRVIDPLKNSTKPLHVLTDNGEAVVKAMGNPAGPEALAFELVGTELARWFGLKTPDFALLPISGLPREWSPHFTVEDGPAFLSRYLAATTYDGDDGLLKKLARPEDIAKLVVFDTWIRNEDRYPPDGSLAEKPANLDNLMFARNPQATRSVRYDLIVFDHTHAFTDAGYDGLSDPALVETDAVYGFFPAFRSYLSETAIKSATDRLRVIDAREMQALMDAVPAQWGLTTGLKRAWADLICRRAHYVADTIDAKIFEQTDWLKGGEDV